jgi:molybdate transport system substrate-binding protein
MGTTSAWNELAPAFTRLTGNKLIVTQESSSTFERLLAANDPADLMVLYGEPLKEVIRRGLVLKDSVTIFARAAVGLSVKSGAPWPDISTPAAFKRTLLETPSFCFSYGGSGAFAARAIEMLGIGALMDPMVVRSEGGPAAG